MRGAIRLAREYDVLHLNLFAPRSRVALIAYAAWPARVLFVDHLSGPTASEDVPPSAMSRWLDRATMARVAGVAGVSNYVRDRARARFTLDRSRVRTIYNGIDLSRFRPGAESRGWAGEIRIVTIANLAPEKGIHHLIGAVARLPDEDVRLVVVGDGVEAERLQLLASMLGIGARTEFLGLRDDVAELLRDADVFVHPAVWAEAFGLTIVEAMASGCPVVASHVGAIPELVEDGVSGLLVPLGDEVALADALRRLLRDPAAQARLGRNAKRRAAGRFTLAACVERHLAWCEEAA